MVETKMNQKEIKIAIPKGYEIDEENSTFEYIKFKPTVCCYEDIMSISELHPLTVYTNPSKMDKLAAINRMIVVAEYLNKGWKPDWNDENSTKYMICMSGDSIRIVPYIAIGLGMIFFKTEELAKKAIEILGEETIKLTLS